MTNATFRAIVKGVWAALGAVAIALSLLILLGCLMVVYGGGPEAEAWLRFTIAGLYVVLVVGSTVSGYVASVHDPARWVLSAALAAVAFELVTILANTLAFGVYMGRPGLLLLSWLIAFAEAAVLGVSAAWIGVFWRRRKTRALA